MYPSGHGRDSTSVVPLHPGRMRGRVDFFQLADGYLGVDCRGVQLGVVEH